MTGKRRLPSRPSSPAGYAVPAQTRGALAHCPGPPAKTPGCSDMCVTATCPIHPKDRESCPLATSLARASRRS